MTDDNSNLVDMGEGDLSLTDFENEFYGTETAEVQDEAEDTETPETDENVDNPDATEADPEDEADEQDDEPEDKPKPKNKTQERIEKLLERERLANERANRLEQRLAAIENASKEEKPTEDKSLRGRLPDEAPRPDAVDDKGEPIYPLGEFDPKYIVDLSKFTFAQEKKAFEEELAANKVKETQEAAQREIVNTWTENVAKVEEELPDLRERIADLTETFQDIEPAYGEYLATTIMASEFGPQIMYFLSQNIGEAQKIVASGPAAATRAIGRLEARFEKPVEAKQPKKVSTAPTPPETRTRGNNGQFAVAPDTDDLKAFEREFYKKK